MKPAGAARRRRPNVIHQTHSALYFRPHDDTRSGDVGRGGRASLHCLSFSAAMCMAYQPAMNAAKPMANSRSALVMLAYNTTAPARSCDFTP